MGLRIKHPVILKHSWDEWNAKLFLITTEKYEAEAKRLLEGSFHEIQHVAKIVNWKHVKEFYKTETKLASLRVKLGLA